jgi:hypothetical protein
MSKIAGWELSLGTYPGVVFGARSYPQGSHTDHVFYLPFVDVCLTVIYDNEGAE